MSTQNFFHQICLMLVSILLISNVSCSIKSDQEDNHVFLSQVTSKTEEQHSVSKEKEKAYENAWAMAEAEYNKNEKISKENDERLQEKEGCEKIKSTSSTPSNRSSYTSHNAPRNDSYSFCTSSDVMAYLMGVPFVNKNNGVTLIFKYEALYVGKNASNFYECNAISGAPIINDFRGSFAIISASSPYTGGILRFRLDASKGRIIEESSGDVYYKR